MIKLYENFLTDLFKKKKSEPLPSKVSGKLNYGMYGRSIYEYDTVYPSLKKQYWARDYYSKRKDEHHWLIIKFIKEEDIKSRRIKPYKPQKVYSFSGIFKDLEDTKIMSIFITKENWINWQEKGVIREATKEEIEHYDFYEQSNKYNL